MFDDRETPKEVLLEHFLETNELKATEPEVVEIMTQQRDLAKRLKQELVEKLVSNPDEPIPEETKDAIAKYREMLDIEVGKQQKVVPQDTGAMTDIRMSITFAKLSYDAGDTEGFKHHIGAAILYAEQMVDATGDEEIEKVLQECELLGLEGLKEY